MDEQSDADSTPSEVEEDAMDLDAGFVGNDQGAEGGLAGEGKSVKGVSREDEVVVPEQVRRWGVVLVGQDGLEGASCALRSSR